MTKGLVIIEGIGESETLRGIKVALYLSARATAADMAMSSGIVRKSFKAI